jgi:hypothetical protein
MRRLLLTVSGLTIVMAAMTLHPLVPTVNGLTVAPAPLATLVDEADTIIHGHVIARSYEPVLGHPGLVQTRLTVWTWEMIKSAPVPLDGIYSTQDGQVLVDITLPGGVMDGIVTVVPGVPRYEPGDEMVALLTMTPRGLAPIGYSLGSWRVTPAGRLDDGASLPTGDISSPGPSASVRAFTAYLRALVETRRYGP